MEGENVLQELVLKLAMAYMYIKEQGLGVGWGRKVGRREIGRVGEKGKQNQKKSWDTMGEKPECPGLRGHDSGETKGGLPILSGVDQQGPYTLGSISGFYLFVEMCFTL